MTRAAAVEAIASLARRHLVALGYALAQERRWSQHQNRELAVDMASDYARDVGWHAGAAFAIAESAQDLATGAL